MRWLVCILPIVTLLTIACNKDQYTIPSIAKAEIGKTLPDWSEGNLDIHLINTARGECCFYIMPDGTTMLVDAGEVQNDILAVPKNVPAHRAYAYYLKHFIPSDQKAIDYCAPSHFHIDHIGGEDSIYGTAEAGYRKSGLMALYDYVPYNHILDRAYPSYTEDDTTPPIEGQLSQDWATFVTWGVANGKFTAERFMPGKEQMVMLKNPTKYGDKFKIFNICANGFVWGKGDDGSETLLGSKPTTTGNVCSCGFHITYGKFDYIACGDLVSTPQNLVACYFRDFIGNGKLEAFKCHHHHASNGWGAKMKALKFDPKVALNHGFSSVKPYPSLLEYVLSYVEGFFSTNIHPAVSEANPVAVSQVAGHSGHIVLRVLPGGEYFNVYVLDDSSFDYKVKSIHGPYTSK